MRWLVKIIIVMKIWTGMVEFGPSSLTYAADLRLTIEPKDTVVVLNGTAILDCAAESSDVTAVPEIKWRANGDQPLTFIGDTHRSRLDNGSLSVHIGSAAYDELQGNYQCIASLPHVGSVVSRKASLTLAPQLQISTPPKDIIVFPGQTAFFNCFVDVSLEVSVMWLKDNRPLLLDETRMLVLPSGALEIDEVQLLDEGNYQCNVTMLGQNQISEKAVLKVDKNAGIHGVTPPVFVALPRPSVVIAGSTVTLDCAAVGNPNPSIVWLKDGIAIDMSNLDSRFQKIGQGSLQISNVQEADEGTYQCRAENGADSVDAAATLEVQVPPHFLKRPADTHASEKQDLELECKMYGKPEPKVHWEKNGDVIWPNEYIHMVNGYNLKILGLMTMDAGIFQCMGSNPAGNIQAAAQLTVSQSVDFHDNSLSHSDVVLTNFTQSPHSAAPPIDEERAPVQDVPSAPQFLEAVIVSTRFVTLSWKPPANARGEILAYSVYYRREGSQRERIMNTTRSRLEEVNIPGLMPDKLYHFRVVAYNEHGPGASSDILRVKTQAEVHVPGPPRGLTVIATSPTSLLVQWQPPDLTNGLVQHYKMFYMQEGSVEEHHIVTPDLQYELTDLNKFTEYSVWVVAVNQNGPGSSTEEKTARTLSDVPTEPPQNVTLEASSSTSVIVRWEPPPRESQNGIITGYKLRYRKKDRKRGDTVTTPGDRRLYALINLDRRSVYQVRLWALNVNGSSPPTEWHTTETFENDLDESQVPDTPVGLKARPMTDSITVSWNPPRNQNIMVRGYTIGWGKGIPDAYTQLLDGKQRYYVIEQLAPNSEYVISLRAYNEMGDGRPVYTSVRTREEMAPEPLTPLVPPVGLMAIVLSSRSVVVYWTDTTLSKNQFVTDNRYYVVRYTSSHHSPNPRYKYLNSSDLNLMIDDLKPNTQYEFTVKVVKGRRSSPWSMVVMNMTQEERPSSQPRDLTVVPVEDNPTIVNLNWQPPKQSNGPITGYVILYTSDNTLNDRDWVAEGIVGDKMTTSVKNLSPQTTYYFKIQARNNKGYGPFSAVVTFTTGIDNPGITNTMMYIIVGCSLLLGLAVTTALAVICCKRRNTERSKKGYIKGNTKSKAGKTNIKPPDLWIHHDQMELKALEKTQSSPATNEMTAAVATLPQSSREYEPEQESKFHQPSTATNSLDKRAYVAPYIVGPNSDEKTSTARRVIKPKPINITASSQPSRELASGGAAAGQPAVATDVSRPQYPRTQYSISRAHVTLDQSATQSPENPYSMQSNYEPSTSHQQGPYSAGLQQSAASTQEPGGSGTIGKRLQGHPLKSFSVPAPPPQSAPSTPQQKHIMRPQGSSSPYKKAGILTNTPASSVGSVPKVRTASVEDPNTIQPSYSTEELNQEMANLEGLMKDLNAITASEFEC
ncbi:neogenin [Schistocerca americana]|uniref:neogenin n=1 Tax=Schistocerca americana TaxID=7009 RepID=UPI001F4FE652|nr:neogenin [Schistocerca americana]